MKKLKGALRSVTIRFNMALATIAGMVEIAIQNMPFIQTNLPQFVDYLSPETFKILTGVLLVGNMILRFKTTTCLSDKVDSAAPKQ